MRILIATANSGKLQEFQQLLAGDAEVVSLEDLKLPSPPENGETFEANAEMKAKYAAGASGLLTVADDSGLEVEVLHGAPGVYSARYAGDRASDEANRALLLKRLGDVPAELRGARFVSAISICQPAGQCMTFRGEWKGHIAVSARGKGGFGYDSLFELPDGRTAAELTATDKNRISHRAVALGKALPYLRSLVTSDAWSEMRAKGPS